MSVTVSLIYTNKNPEGCWCYDNEKEDTWVGHSHPTDPNRIIDALHRSCARESYATRDLCTLCNRKIDRLSPGLQETRKERFKRYLVTGLKATFSAVQSYAVSSFMVFRITSMARKGYTLMEVAKTFSVGSFLNLADHLNPITDWIGVPIGMCNYGFAFFRHFNALSVGKVGLITGLLVSSKLITAIALITLRGRRVDLGQLKKILIVHIEGIGGICSGYLACRGIQMGIERYY